ncbi:MAG TPA: 16S rRNA (cytosine(967)-C(5))-methyltransferase RsmB [Bacilli bacterium]|nr:MAG: Ribosomal RNA small subunit methyltransferase B [Tenericutes bacterium ADurb.BinA124]HNZ50460.1 16S rRNA (cytosine(967)-C(5))-methyltransferase RsmB [Bacilli bacterium]HPX83952.1 16S rRNA (cytosine(967)-C(5))-methyltransferase RsmB [Bacilli bacterium]HQC74700.1 16S rRNA (cytosine(967)-C(5))-methyltransferase RsmB [Bacilli bacterium]
MMNPRKLALEAIEKIIAKKAYSNLVVNDYLNRFEFSPEDKSLFAKLVYGTLERMLTLDFYLEPYFGKKAPKPWVKYLLEMSAYQLIFLRIPDYAVVNEAVDIANLKDRHIGSFVNAVLRNLQRNPLRTFDYLEAEELLAVKYSFPLWLVTYLLKDYSLEVVEKILEAYFNDRNEGIRINSLKISKDDLLFKLAENNLAFQLAPIGENALVMKGDIQKHPLFTSGFITIQDLSSQRVAEIINPQEEDVVLDVCAAPGGKSAHLAALMNNTGQIFACDIHAHKIKLMEKTFKRLGVINVKTQQIDALLLSEVVKAETFDHVLADVPCSGLGVLSHKVDIKYHLSLNSIQEIKKLQAAILEKTWGIVKKGGFYTYSTCTINKEENEEQIRTFLSNHPEFKIVHEETILPHEYQCDGFYICKMRRG